MKRSKFKKSIMFFMLILALLFMLASNAEESCDYGSYQDTSDSFEKKETEKLMKESYSQIGMPAIKNFQEKKMLKLLYELKDQEKLICYAYYFNSFQGKRGDFIGRCIGYGLPASVQFSNPEKLTYEDVGESMGMISVPQPEPNGLFMPEGLSATYLMLIDEKTGKARPVYIEPQIIVSPFQLH